VNGNTGTRIGHSTIGDKGRATRQAILDAATQRFGRDGYKATSLADIARDAGIGGSAIYPYFENKKALFAQALDDDVTAIINEAVSSVLTPGDDSWRETLVGSLLDSMAQHPLAKRVLAGVEQEETIPVIDLPALAELRSAVAERLRSDQAAGRARSDIDPVLLADGGVTIFLSMLMSVVQLGTNTIARSGPGVMAVIAAALDPIESDQ
jgi:AcrR family transcriptional regulator